MSQEYNEVPVSAIVPKAPARPKEPSFDVIVKELSLILSRLDSKYATAFKRGNAMSFHINNPSSLKDYMVNLATLMEDMVNTYVPDKTTRKSNLYKGIFTSVKANLELIEILEEPGAEERDVTAIIGMNSAILGVTLLRLKEFYDERTGASYSEQET